MRVSNSLVRKRLVFSLFIGILVFVVITVRLGYVQFVLGDELTEKAKGSWGLDIPFEPKRGEIVDRNGEVLATNVSAPSVLVVPKQVEQPANTADKLAALLQVDRQKVYETVTKEEATTWLHPEGRKLDSNTADRIRQASLPGIYIAQDFKRHYPFGNYLSHSLGFAGIDNQGLVGLEKIYDEALKGEKGKVAFYADIKGNRMPFMSDEYVPPKSGHDLVLTVDTGIQTIIERELDIVNATYDPDGAWAIAMDPDNGEILGMASRPGFNPENFRNVSPDIYNQNKPIWSTYEPGSTFKIITLASALEENVVDLDEDTFFDPGHIEVGGTKLHCWKSGGHGEQTYLEVVQNSCNPGFVALGQKIGKETLFSYIHDFGFGQKTGIDLAGEGRGILFDVENVGPVELGTTSFGQGVSVTPIQQVVAVSAAVNGGYLYRPFIAKKLVDPETGEIVKETEPKMKERIISEETSKEVRRALESVVAKGTGKNAFVDGYRIGGKTGTAQKAVGGKYLKNNHIVSFIGFAPSDDPEIVVYVAIDNPKDTLQFGGVVAAPVAGQIIGDSLRYMGVEKRDEQMEKDHTWNDDVLVETPDLIGKTKAEVRRTLYTLKVETSGSGDTVVHQAPAPGVKVREGATIRLFMGDK